MNIKPTTTELNPVTPPAATPLIDSIKLVTFDVPRVEPAIVPIASE